MNAFENKVLFIKDEEMIEEVKQMILQYGFKVGHVFEIMCSSFSYLYYNTAHEQFKISFKANTDQEITLEQFNELLKQK